MTDRQLHVFVDESGDNRLDSSRAGTSHLFHLAAVVVDDEQKLAAEQQLDAISRDLFGGAEIKSSRIAGKNARRARVLQAIRSIDFGYYGLIVNKDKIDRDSGYQWKTSFYKSTSRKIYRKVDTSYSDRLHIYRDRIGSSEYMESFVSYLGDLNQSTLFRQTSHEFVASRESRLVQLADLIAGTLSYCFDASKRSEFTAEFRSILAEKELSIDVWPVTYDAVGPSIVSDGLSETIYRNLLGKAAHYLDGLADGSSDEDQMRECVLSKLLYARLYDDSKEGAIYSEKLIDHLADAGYEKLTKQLFTASIIAKIRDAGVIIAGTSVGYRLALSVEDIHSYLEHNRSVIYPMLSRIKKAQETIRAATANEHDILGDDKLLASIVDTHYNGQLGISTEQYEGEEDRNRGV